MLTSQTAQSNVSTDASTRAAELLAEVFVGLVKVNTAQNTANHQDREQITYSIAWSTPENRLKCWALSTMAFEFVCNALIGLHSARIKLALRKSFDGQISFTELAQMEQPNQTLSTHLQNVSDSLGSIPDVTAAVVDLCIVSGDPWSVATSAHLSIQDSNLVLNFDPMQIEPVLAFKLLEHVACVIEQLQQSDKSSDAIGCISDLSLFTPQQTQLICDQASGAVQVCFDGLSMVDVFDQHVKATPDAVALAWDGGACTYSQLHEQSLAFAAQFTRAGVTAGNVVAVSLARSDKIYAIFLGLLRAHAIYLPLDPHWPNQRVEEILRTAGAQFNLTASGDSVSLSRLHSGESTLDGRRGLAYVMFTSGSTGTPKGVLISQKAILRLTQQAQYLKLDRQLRLLQAAPLGFDASTLEIWGPLLNGGCCVLHHELIPTARGLQKTIAQLKANTAWLTAALFNHIIDQGADYLTGLQQLAIGGEALSADHVRRALRAHPKLRLVNGYGPTECTTFAATYDIPHSLSATQNNIPIGFALTNTETRVLNQDGQLIPAGFVGELCLGGDGLAEGYIHNAELTAEKFVLDPYGKAGARLYKTGDRVRLLPNGALEFLGRRDTQVKLRGHRIELGEVEAALNRQSHVTSSCAVVMPLNQEMHLVAYLVMPAELFSIANLRAGLKLTLPDAMVPTQWVRLDALPITPNGKLDRAALPKPLRHTAHGQAPVTQTVNSLSAIEQHVAQSFCFALGLPSVALSDHFFELGGTSLGVTRAVAELERRLGFEVPVASFFGDPTVSGIAKLLAAETNTPTPMAAAAVSEPIAIIGMAINVPGASNLEQFWQNLVSGTDSISRFSAAQLDPSLDPALVNDPDYVPARGVIQDFDQFDAAFFGISPTEAELMDPQQRLFLELCWQCLEHAGCAPGSNAANDQVGVFAGVYNASYFQQHVLRHPEKIAAFGEFQVMLANEKDYVATRVAHRLNLNGPAVNVFTACSTSLVAIAQAIDSLRLGRCRAALAGGASVTCPPNSGYLYQEGSMLSPDGATRSFDNQAAGTVFSDGAAVVLLKRLNDAVKDGDTIYAIVRGAAINNDGAEKASFTAPSVQGQTAVVRQAQFEAGVTPDQIDYVEAHGTATPLGDPVEIDALKRAFGQSTNNKICYIGSVKSNIGHTVMAAGAAGVIKTVMALQHQLLPATAHFKQASPRLGLDNSRFKIVAQNTPWPRGEQPRIAAVSAFGVGGTNAHVILSDPPTQAALNHTRAQQDQDNSDTDPITLKLSARTPNALEASAARLAAWLKSNPTVNSRHVAHTLAQGRKPFAQRLVAVGNDSLQLITALLDPQSGFTGRASVDGKAKSMTWLFPGQGAQYVSMGQQLYKAQPIIRTAMDHCFSALQERSGFNLKPIMFEADQRTLAQTANAQPALFTLEYALAQYWLSLGLVPDHLIGHSVGEFAAATIAGVMSVEDAVNLVATRGKLMQAMPSGAMLAVRQSLDVLLAQLPKTLSLAASNSPIGQVVAGPDEAIDAFSAELAKAEVPHKKLDTSHAFHSTMMAPAVEQFRRVLQKVSLRSPRLNVISTVTGQLLTSAQATSAEYWATHLQLPVQFGSAVKTCLAQGDQQFLEVGPNQHLSGLIRHQLSQPSDSIVLCSLANHADLETRYLALAAAKRWATGQTATATLPGQRIALPTYSFERRTFWLAATKPFFQDTTSSPIMSTAKNNAPVDQSPRLFKELEQLFETVSGVDLVGSDPNTRFTELGLDSLALTQVALQVKRKYSVKITFRDLMENYSSMSALVSYVLPTLPPVHAQLSTTQTASVQPALQPAQTLQPAPTSALTTATTVLPAHSLPSGVAQSAITQLIANQLQLMQQQLSLLSGVAPTQTQLQPILVDSQPVPAPASPSEIPAPTALSADEQPNNEPQRYDVKKAFGAIARIHTTRTSELTTKQKNRLDALIDRYTARTAKSKAYTVEHRPHLADPRVVNGFRPALKEIIYQIVIERSAGAHVWDLDGNRYVDALNGFGMSLFGWQPSFLADALKKQIDLGYEIGPQHSLAGIVAKQFCEITGSERAAFCNTGSEAVMGAVRIARTVTGKHLIVSFSGAYHGIFDEVVVRGSKNLRTMPAAPGIMNNAGDNVLVLEYGTAESLQIIRDRADDIAAVLVEPVQSRRPDFQPVEYLKSLRQLTTDSGIALVFDEIVTGFRCHQGGIQALFGIRADLATYGKIIGGGLSIGVVAGKREFMDALDGGAWSYGDDSIPTVGVTYFAGTFVRHPLALAAAHAVLNHMNKQGPSLQEDLNQRTGAMVKALNLICKNRNAPIEIRHFASVWRTTFLEDHPYQDLLFAMMRSRGIHILDNFPCFLTTAHSAEDISAIVEAFEDALTELQEGGFIPGRPAEVIASMDASKPPVMGARLGRNQEGKVVWFVENPEKAGKFIEYKSA
jgi:amino acid adenylation domain-containing protein